MEMVHSLHTEESNLISDLSDYSFNSVFIFHLNCPLLPALAWMGCKLQNKDVIFFIKDVKFLGILKLGKNGNFQKKLLH